MYDKKFKKSTFSDDGVGGMCVSVQRTIKRVLVKHIDDDLPILDFSHREWKAFIKGVKASEFDV